jgi:hypothetical protein
MNLKREKLKNLDLKALCRSFHSLQLPDSMDHLIKFFDGD